jgi:hypothetical protein
VQRTRQAKDHDVARYGFIERLQLRDHPLGFLLIGHQKR